MLRPRSATGPSGRVPARHEIASVLAFLGLDARERGYEDYVRACVAGIERLGAADEAERAKKGNRRPSAGA